MYDELCIKNGKLMVERNCKQENMSELKFAGDTSDTMKCLILYKSKNRRRGGFLVLAKSGAGAYHKKGPAGAGPFS